MLRAVNLEYVALLGLQRKIYGTPPGPERFRAYLREMLDAQLELKLPLVAMNPMADEYAVERLDALLAIGADRIGAAATEEAVAAMGEASGDYRVTLVLADDVRGAWTHRAAAELAHRRGEAALAQRGWLTGMLWASERPNAADVREEVLTTIHRAAYIGRRGPARTLRQLLIQEGNAMRLAGARNPVLEPHAFIRARDALRAHLDRDDQGALVAGLFGDAAARELGYEPIGIPPRAGLALALHGRLEPRERRPSRNTPSATKI
jgi:hypothetical protein